MIIEDIHQRQANKNIGRLCANSNGTVQVGRYYHLFLCVITVSCLIATIKYLPNLLSHDDNFNSDHDIKRLFIFSNLSLELKDGMVLQQQNLLLFLPKKQRHELGCTIIIICHLFVTWGHSLLPSQDLFGPTTNVIYIQVL